ncbi:protein rep, partial [Clostridium sardiniense]|uniref:protein rep n=1 Tax=Clostridium sardiniense TaxID=29369 RepID=UPI003D344F97
FQKERTFFKLYSNNDNIKALKSKENTKIKKKEILDKCKDKKERNIKFKNFIKDKISERNLEYIKDCGSYLGFITNKEISIKKLVEGNFCKNRFCPFCAWRKSLKEALKIKICMEHLQKEEDQEFYFLTLTAPNIVGAELEEEIKHYNKSFKRLMQRKDVQAVVTGYVRKLEVTYSSERYITKALYKKKKNYYDYKGLKIGDLEPNYNTYHPHFHVIISVKRNDIKNNRGWIKQERWLQLWREATGNSSITQVDFKKVRDIRDGKEAIEIAKYAAKDDDYLHSQEVFDIFYNALKGKQMIVYSGLFKEAVKMYKNGDLDCYKEKDKEEYIYKLMYKWFIDRYEEEKIRELTEEEYSKYNGVKIEEVNDS